MIDPSENAKTRNIVEALRQQHTQIERMLVAFERQLAIFEDGGSADYELVERVIALCVDCLNPRHCAWKKSLLIALFNQQVVDGVTAETIGAEYERVVQGAHKIAAVIEAVFHDAEVGRQTVSRIAHDFIDACRRQIKTEDQVFFPAAVASLKPSDWDAIDDAISATAGRLSDERTGASRRAPYQKIVSWDEVVSVGQS